MGCVVSTQGKGRQTEAGQFGRSSLLVGHGRAWAPLRLPAPSLSQAPPLGGASAQSQCCPLQGICLHGTFPGATWRCRCTRGCPRALHVGSPSLSPCSLPSRSAPSPSDLASPALPRGNDYSHSCTISQCLASFFENNVGSELEAVGGPRALRAAAGGGGPAPAVQLQRFPHPSLFSPLLRLQLQGKCHLVTTESLPPKSAGTTTTEWTQWSPDTALLCGPSAGTQVLPADLAASITSTSAAAVPANSPSPDTCQQKRLPELTGIRNGGPQGRSPTCGWLPIFGCFPASSWFLHVASLEKPSAVGLPADRASQASAVQEPRGLMPSRRTPRPGAWVRTIPGHASTLRVAHAPLTLLLPCPRDTASLAPWPGRPYSQGPHTHTRSVCSIK